MQTTTLEPFFETDYREPPAPKVLCVIPARGGSKGFPGKNIADLLGKPLLAHTIQQAQEARTEMSIVVSTDDDEIASVARKYGANVLMRPPELASDRAPSEWALIHALSEVRKEGFEPSVIVMLQCTSPIRRARDIDNALDLLYDTGSDSLLSGVRAHQFIWQGSRDDVRPLNYDYRNRPIRQYRPSEWVENGSIYICKRWVLDDMANRLGGRIAIYEMGLWSKFEIDQADDLELCEWIMEREGM